MRIGIMLFILLLSFSASAKDPACEAVAKSATVSQSNYNFSQNRQLIDNKELSDIQTIFTSKPTLQYEDLKKIRRIMIDADKERESLREKSKSARAGLYEAAYKGCLAAAPMMDEMQMQADFGSVVASSLVKKTANVKVKNKDWLAEIVGDSESRAEAEGSAGP